MEPCILFSTKPNTCSTLTRVLDFSLLLAICSSVKGLFSFLNYFVDDFFLFVNRFLIFSCISAVSIKRLSLVFTCQQLFHSLRVMYRCISNNKFFYEFCFGVGFYMIFISIEGRVVFLSPSGINILLR